MYIATIPNRSSPPAILLRESYRQGGQVKTRPLANLTAWPPAQLDALRHVLRGDLLVAPEDALEIVRSLPPGHVAAVLGYGQKQAPVFTCIRERHDSSTWAGDHQR